jgi:gas vesicle protein
MNSNQKFLAGVLLGAAAGVALTIFFSSEKGKELVGSVADAAGGATDKIKDKFSDFKGSVSDLVEKGKNVVQSVTDKAASVIS